MAITIQHVKLAGIEADAALLLRDEAIVAVLSRLPDDLTDEKLWFVEWSTEREGLFDEGFATLEAASAAFEAAND